MGYSPQGRKMSDMTESYLAHTHTHTHTHTHKIQIVFVVGGRGFTVLQKWEMAHLSHSLSDSNRTLGNVLAEKLYFPDRLHMGLPIRHKTVQTRL